jgi:hypothetical protein
MMCAKTGERASMTQEQADRIILLSGALCARALSCSTRLFGSQTVIPSSIIAQLRQALDEAGYDMDAALRMVQQIEEER